MIRDPAGNIYIAGGGSPDFPVTTDAAQPVPTAVPIPTSFSATIYDDPFLMELSPDASTLLYSTFLSVELTEMKMGSDGKISGLGYSFAPFSQDAYQPCNPSGPAFVRLSANQPGIEYSSGTPDPTSSGSGSVFDFETSGIAYVTTGVSDSFSQTPPSQYFTTIDLSKAPNSGPVCIAESVNLFHTSIAPGMLVSILGPGVGPDEATPLALDAFGRVATQLAGTEVLFDGIPAPILSAGPTRIDVVTPFGVATQGTTTVSVLRNSGLVGTLANPLAASSLWLYTADGSGFGSPAWNQDGTPNSPGNPAHEGDILTFYGTGAGAMTPTPVDGTIPQSTQSTVLKFSLGALNFNPTGWCPLTYAGDAPGLVEGINWTIGSDAGRDWRCLRGGQCDRRGFPGDLQIQEVIRKAASSAEKTRLQAPG